MKVEVSEFEKVYSFELFPITQLCGQNIVKKTYILESIRRYFGTYKYQEGQDKWRDNIQIDGNIVGRKYFTVFSIRYISDIISTIKCSKQSLMTEYLKHLILKFDMQKHMERIEIELEEMFQILNEDVNQLGDVELVYSMSDIWEMVQKSDIAGITQNTLENMDTFELICIMLKLIEKVLSCSPRKEIFIFENIDHLLSLKQYTELIERLKSIVTKYDVFFVLTTSLDGYVEFDSAITSGISVFGEIDFQMPDLNHMINFVHDNYPCNKMVDEEKIIRILKNIVQRIGCKNYLSTVEENVICKMINQTLMIFECIGDGETVPEIAFLKSNNMI